MVLVNKKVLYKWHKYLGLTLGLILFILGFSGTIITYRDELLPVLYSDLMQVRPQEHRANLRDQIESARTYLKGQDFTHLYTAETDDTSSLIFFRPEGALLPHLLAIDPYTSEVRGTMPLIKNIFGVMIYVHANLLLGKVGSWIVGIMGLLLTGFFITGLIIWWPHENHFLLKIRTLPKSGLRGLHRGLGLFLGLPLVFSALTGFILAFDLMEKFGPSKPKEIVQIQTCNYEDQIKSLDLLSDEQKKNLVSIHFCSPKNGFMKLSSGLHERSGHDGYIRLIVDPKTQTVVQKFDTTVDPETWSMNAITIFPMHSGAYFGGIGRILSFACGIALSILYLTGIYPTLKKRLLKKDR